MPNFFWGDRRATAISGGQNGHSVVVAVVGAVVVAVAGIRVVVRLL